MWLIPGRTKVRLEIFKGVGLVDILIGIVGLILLAVLVVSNFPHRFVVAGVLLFVFAALLARVDGEPNYIFVLHILEHYGLPRRYVKSFDDQMLVNINEKGEKKAQLEFLKNRDDKPQETPEERRARRKEERREYKEDSKRLKAKDLTKEEEDAIWLKRANRSAARKKERHEEIEAVANWEDMDQLMACTAIKDGFLEYAGQYYGAAIEIEPVEFRFFSRIRRDASINNGIGKVLRSLGIEQAANIVKIDRPVHYDKYIEAELAKVDALRASFEAGMMREDELKARIDVVYDRIKAIENLVDNEKIIIPFYYLVLFHEEKSQLVNLVNNALDNLEQAELPASRLDSKELALFLKYSNVLDVNEKELDELEEEYYAAWASPNEVSFKVRTAVVDRIKTHTMHITGYPSLADDAWLAAVMSIPGTKCVIKAKPMDMDKAVRGIDRSLAELRSQYSSTNVDSKLIELQSHIESLSELLTMIQGENENLLDVNIYVTMYDYEGSVNDPEIEAPEVTSLPHIHNMKKTIRRIYRENGLRLSNMDFEQLRAFVATQVSAYDPFEKSGRGMPANSISASYPWVFASVSDVGGIMLGSQDGIPVFIDFFRRDSERVNSNMVIVGKSGSGKSYATKTLLANLAADDSKIFILDPENEYTELANNLHGKFINVGNAQHGRLNPFHIMTAIDDEEMEEGTVSGSYATHLQFLEEFFRQILPDCEKDAMEYLNSIVDRMYTNMGITAESDLTKLAPEDFPVFDDLYDAILQEFQKTDNAYIRTMLRTLMNYISKFSTGGRNANIWNGPSTVTTDENFSVFNFQSLLSNRNTTIANAQMLLVLKYIDNEIIKNRDYNTRNHMKRKVIVVIDEAHVFIDEKFPIALDFMFQLAKRIRKYNGMQIVITQNIKDFVGTEELARKSTAIINACQYSFVFPLAANDMDDLCKLYEKAGGINESEQEGIVGASRGQAFTILSPASRSSFQIQAPDHVRQMFEELDVESTYFGTDPDDEVWLDFLQDSRDKHNEAIANRRSNTSSSSESAGNAKKHVFFEEVSMEDFENSLTKMADRISTEALEETVSKGIEEISDDDFGDSSFDIPEIPEDPDDFKRIYDEFKSELDEIGTDKAPTGLEAMNVDVSEDELQKAEEAFYADAAVSEEKPVQAPIVEPAIEATTAETPKHSEVSNPSIDYLSAIASMNAEAERRNQEFQQQLMAQMNERDQASARTEMLLAKILEQMAESKQQADIQQIIEAEVEKRVALMMQSFALNFAAGMPAGVVAGATSTTVAGAQAEVPQSKTDLHDESKDDESQDNDTQDSDAQDDGSSGVSLGNIFDLAGEMDADTADDSDDYSDDSSSSFSSDSSSSDDADYNFDIMALLAEQASYMDGVSAIEQMELYDEEVIDITLEDLTKYIQNMA